MEPKVWDFQLNVRAESKEELIEVLQIAQKAVEKGIQSPSWRLAGCYSWNYAERTAEEFRKAYGL